MELEFDEAFRLSVKLSDRSNIYVNETPWAAS